VDGDENGPMSKEQPEDAQPVAAGPAKVAGNFPKLEEEGLLFAGVGGVAAFAEGVNPATTTARNSGKNFD